MEVVASRRFDGQRVDGRFHLRARPRRLGVDAAAKKATFDVIYVNGDHAVQNGKIKPAEGLAQLKVRQIEAEFLEKMFACEEV